MNQINDINEYMEECYFEANNSWPKEQIIKRCSERWALKELLYRIGKSNSGAINVAMDFLEELMVCEEMDDSGLSRFTYAKNVVEEVAMLLSKPSI